MAEMADEKMMLGSFVRRLTHVESEALNIYYWMVEFPFWNFNFL
jgi:hypothetical protein